LEHGIFEYLKTIPYPENCNVNELSYEDIEKLFTDNLLEQQLDGSSKWKNKEQER
jgi:hypothetical protein